MQDNHCGDVHDRPSEELAGSETGFAGPVQLDEITVGKIDFKGLILGAGGADFVSPSAFSRFDCANFLNFFPHQRVR